MRTQCLFVREGALCSVSFQLGALTQFPLYRRTGPAWGRCNFLRSSSCGWWHTDVSAAAEQRLPGIKLCFISQLPRGAVREGGGGRGWDVCPRLVPVLVVFQQPDSVAGAALPAAASPAALAGRLPGSRKRSCLSRNVCWSVTVCPPHAPLAPRTAGHYSGTRAPAVL